MTSERLQAVISALTSSKFYRLPPDRENPYDLNSMCAAMVKKSVTSSKTAKFVTCIKKLEKGKITVTFILTFFC